MIRAQIRPRTLATYDASSTSAAAAQPGRLETVEEVVERGLSEVPLTAGNRNAVRAPRIVLASSRKARSSSEGLNPSASDVEA
jgi:hypothetical protein